MLKRKEWIILIFGFFTLTTIFACFNFWGLYEKIALSGFSPIHYTHLKLVPENFVSNFKSGVEAYDMSLLMALYPFFDRYFDIPPEVTLKGMIILEYFVLFLTSFFLLKELRPRSGLLEIFGLWFVFCSSYGLDSNLANAGYFIQGQFYNFAYFFAIIGILLCLKERFFLAVLFFMITILIHSVLGVMAIFLALFTFFPSPKLIFHKRTFLPFFLLGVGMMIWVTWIFFQSTPSSGNIPQELWVCLTRMGNCHWYPYHLGFLTENPWNFLIPFLCFLLLLTHYFPLQKEMTEKDKKILFIYAGGIFLTIVGILISVFFPSPILIKLSLHRASLFVLFFGWPYLLSGLFQDIKEGTVLQKSLALTTFLFPFIQRYNHFMILPTLLLTRSTMKYTLESFFSARVKAWIICTILGILLFLLGLKGFSGFLECKDFLIKTIGIKWWTYFFLIYATFLILNFFRKIKYNIFKKIMPFFIFLTMIFLVLIFQLSRIPNNNEVKKGRNYLETQLWAKTYTPNNALFMVDPTIHYGWRDFSQRSSFGNSREWIHVSWLYDSNERVFREGMHRFSLYNLPIENYLTGFFPTINGHSKLNKDVENAFYSFDESWFNDIQQNFGIQYIVMQKEKIKKEYTFPIVFENQQFIIFKLPELSNNISLKD